MNEFGDMVNLNNKQLLKKNISSSISTLDTNRSHRVPIANKELNHK